MASSTAAPYGLRPVNLIGGQPYAGSTRLMKIASGYAANIYFGQPVTIIADGTIQVATVTTSAPATGVAGVFMGVTYTDPNLNIPVWKQYWPSGTVASDAYAYIVDDPDVVLQVQANGSVAQDAIGANIGLLAASGSTGTGNSTVAASIATIDVTASLPLRIVGIAGTPAGSTTTSSPTEYTDILVKWNMPYNNSGTMTGGHAYMNPTGI